MTQKVLLIALALVVLPQASFAAAGGYKPKEVLAVCKTAQTEKAAFWIVGDISKFDRNHPYAITEEVELRNSANANAFNGKVTLTKGAPYHFTLYGQSKPKMAEGKTEITLYGWSSGKKMTVQETRTKTLEIAQFNCALNPALLATP